MIKGKAADIIIVLYIMATLYVRFLVEPSLIDHPFISLALGFVMLLILWSLIKVKFLEPDYFGLLSKKSSE